MPRRSAMREFESPDYMTTLLKTKWKKKKKAYHYYGGGIAGTLSASYLKRLGVKPKGKWGYVVPTQEDESEK